MGTDDGGSPAPGGVTVDGRSVRRVLEGVEGCADDAGARAVAAVPGVDAVDDVRDDERYPLAGLVEAVDELAVANGEDAVASVGREFGANVTLAGDVTTVPDALTALDDAYRERHRGDAGGYTFRQIGETDGRIECHTPYPCAFDRGLVDGVAVAHADGFVCLSEVGRCRTDGATRCTYELTW